MVPNLLRTVAPRELHTQFKPLLTTSALIGDEVMSDAVHETRNRMVPDRAVGVSAPSFVLYACVYGQVNTLLP